MKLATKPTLANGMHSRALHYRVSAARVAGYKLTVPLRDAAACLSDRHRSALPSSRARERSGSSAGA